MKKETINNVKDVAVSAASIVAVGALLKVGEEIVDNIVKKNLSNAITDSFDNGYSMGYDAGIGDARDSDYYKNGYSDGIEAGLKLSEIDDEYCHRCLDEYDIDDYPVAASCKKKKKK